MHAHHTKALSDDDLYDLSYGQSVHFVKIHVRPEKKTIKHSSGTRRHANDQAQTKHHCAIKFFKRSERTLENDNNFL